MKTYAAMGFSTPNDCLEFMRQYELSEVDSSAYSIDEIDGISFFFGPKVEEEMRSKGIGFGGCSPLGDIMLDIPSCKSLAREVGMEVDYVVKFILHHEFYHQKYDFNGGVTFEEFVERDVDELTLGAESEINADLHSAKINGLTVDEYLTIRGAIRKMLVETHAKYDNIEEHVVSKLVATQDVA